MEAAWQRSVRVCFGPVASPPSLESGHSDRALAVQSSASLALVLAPLHLHNAPARALQHRQADRDKREREHEAKVRAWALKEPGSSLPSLPHSNPMRLPVDDDELINCCMVVPPALDIGKRLLDASQKLKGGAQKQLAATLQSTWCGRHGMLRRADAPAFVAAQADTPSLRQCEKCYHVEWCICEGGASVALAKGDPVRLLMSSAHWWCFWL